MPASQPERTRPTFDLFHDVAQMIVNARIAEQSLEPGMYPKHHLWPLQSPSPPLHFSYMYLYTSERPTLTMYDARCAWHSQVKSERCGASNSLSGRVSGAMWKGILKEVHPRK